MKRLGICTGNRNYDAKLQEYLSSRIDQEYVVMIFSGREALLKENEKERMDVVIIEESIQKDIWDEDKRINGKKSRPWEMFGRIICLCEDINRLEVRCEEIGCDNNLREEVASNMKRIYKYSPATAILSEAGIEETVQDKRIFYENLTDNVYKADTDVCGNGVENAGKLLEKYVLGQGTKMVGIYSPIGGAGVTGMSLAAAGNLYPEGRVNSPEDVLFVSLEAFSSLAEILYLDDRYTLSEALYSFMTQRDDRKRFNMAEIRQYIGRTDNYCVIAPVRNYCELTKVSEDDWRQFFEMIIGSKEYRYLIIELSDAVNGLFSLLEMCDTVLIPQREEMGYSAKMETFIKELKNRTTNDFFEKRVRIVEVPEYPYGEMNYENIENTRYGKWAKSINEWL